VPGLCLKYSSSVALLNFLNIRHSAIILTRLAGFLYQSKYLAKFFIHNNKFSGHISFFLKEKHLASGHALLEEFYIWAYSTEFLDFFTVTLIPKGLEIFLSKVNT